MASRYIHNLKKGKHAFKFVVDDEWRFAPDQPTVADIEGRINNFIDVSDDLSYVCVCDARVCFCDVCGDDGDGAGERLQALHGRRRPHARRQGGVARVAR